MALGAGTRLGPYEIGSPLGVGGMGEVYRARDTKLDREVAIKVLPESFAADPERVARFEREAKTLASLNHPNIGQIFTVEERLYNVHGKEVNTPGNGELLVGGPHDSVPMSVSPDGRFLIFRYFHPETGRDLWRLPLQGNGEPQVLVRSPFQEENGVVSPDGRWLAYQSNESGRAEIYVQGFPDPGERWPISTDGGTEPAWPRCASRWPPTEGPGATLG